VCGFLSIHSNSHDNNYPSLFFTSRPDFRLLD
jgi:hypothetical protein